MEIEFTSQIATTREQSARLIALGIKKETADMYYSCNIICAKPYHKVVEFMNGCVPEDIFPAWSLHRLIEMMPMSLAEDKRYHECWDLNVTPIAVIYRNQDEEDKWIGECMGRGLYNNLIDCIEWLIKEGYFNKEFLEEE